MQPTGFSDDFHVIYIVWKLKVELVTMQPVLTALKQRTFEKFVGKGENAWYPEFSPFPTMFSSLSKAMFSSLSKTEIAIRATANLLSANAFSLVVANIL